MSTKLPNRKRIAVLGGGPIGVEAALYAAALGHDVRLDEADAIGGHVRLWGHVEMFSPWRLNRSALGRRTLARTGLPPADDTHYPTGREFVESYLEPLARCRELSGRVHEGQRVVQIGRDRIGKRAPSGLERRRFPFRLLLEDAAGKEQLVHADVVLDCTGTYGHPNRLGSGNVAAPGERALGARIDYRLCDVSGADRAEFERRRVLLVGAGHSAATALDALTRLDDVAVTWISRGEDASPLPVVPDDPLPQRDRLARIANELARGGDRRVRFRAATVVERVASGAGGFEVELSGPGGTSEIEVDRILAHVGFAPDNTIYRELQVHECYATLGPMKLAAALAGGDAADCLAQAPVGGEALANPEPDFFILGAKSYGNRSNFLIRNGLDQVREVFALIERQPRLDLYAA